MMAAPFLNISLFLPGSDQSPYAPNKPRGLWQMKYNSDALSFSSHLALLQAIPMLFQSIVLRVYVYRS